MSAASSGGHHANQPDKENDQEDRQLEKAHQDAKTKPTAVEAKLGAVGRAHYEDQAMVTRKMPTLGFTWSKDTRKLPCNGMSR